MSIAPISAMVCQKLPNSIQKISYPAKFINVMFEPKTQKTFWKSYSALIFVFASIKASAIVAVKEKFSKLNKLDFGGFNNNGAIRKFTSSQHHDG